MNRIIRQSFQQERFLEMVMNLESMDSLFAYKNSINLMNLETFEVSTLTFDQLGENIIDIVNKGLHYYLISEQKNFINYP